MTDDNKTIKLSLKGSHQAFAMLVDKYKSFVCSIAYCTTGNVETSEDVAQDVFISVWKNLPSLKDTGKFKSWLTSITRNTALTYVQKEAAAVRRSDVDIEQIADHASDNDSAEDNSLVWKTLETLPAEYREAMVLYYRHEKSTAQVAELMEITPDAVRQRLARGRDMLRDRIERRLETNLRNTAPGKKFTASVIAAISTIPVGIAVSEAAVSNTAAVGHLAAPFYAFVSTTTVKIAAVVVAAAAIVTAGIMLTGNNTPKPVTQAPKPNIVETQHLASQTTDTTNPAPAQPTPPVETQGIASPNPDTTNTATSVNPTAATEPAANPEGFTPRGVLSGLITDIKTGEPVIDAQLHIDFPDTYVNTETDENGFYYFDEKEVKSYGKFTLTVQSKEYVGLQSVYNNCLTLNIISGSKAVQHIQLEKACMLDVEVADENGLPVKDVNVVVTDTAWASITPPEPVNSGYVRTDKDGKVMTGGIKASPNPYFITLIHCRSQKIGPKEWITKNDYAATYQTLVMNDPEVIEFIRVVMKKGIDINGRLLYSDGVPPKDFKVGVKPQWWHCGINYPEAEVSEDGTFTIKHIEPGIHDIIAYTPAENQSYMSKKLLTESLEEGKYLDLILPYESPSNLVSFTGRVIIEGDCDVSRIHIFIRNSDNHFGQSIKFEDNIKKADFKIDNIQPGDYSIEFGDNNIKHKSVQNVQIPSTGFECILQCKDIINISGTVLEQESQMPITNFRVFHRVIKSYDKTYTPGNSWVNYPKADAGKFDFLLEDQGVHQFVIDSDGYAPQTIELDTLKNTSFTAQLIKGLTLTGKVLDTNGQPVANAKLIPFTKNTYYSNDGLRTKQFQTDIGSTTSNTDGTFILEKLPTGTETINISHPDYCEKTIDADLTLATEIITITLNAGCTVEGHAYDNNGNPRAGFPLIVFSKVQGMYIFDDSGIAKTTTDKDGYYKLPNLPEQFLFISNPSLQNTEGVCRNYVLPEEGKTTVLDFGGTYYLVGRIFLNGSPLSDAELLVTDAVTSRNYFINNGHTSSDGSFVFSGIQEGRNRLVYKMSNSPNTWIDIAEFDTEGVDLNLGDLVLDCLDVEITIEGGENIEINHCGLTENFGSLAKIGRSLTSVDRGVFNIKNVRAGKHQLYIQRSKDWASWKYDIEVPSTDKLFTTKIKLPVMTSSVYGKLPAADVGFDFKNDDANFSLPFRNIDKDDTYKIEKIPAGKYIVENYSTDVPITTFELAEGQALELDLDQLDIPRETIVTADIITVDGATRRQIGGCKIWLETGGVKCQDATLSYIQAPPGRYTLCITHAGYKDYRKEVELIKDDAQLYPRPKITAVLERQ